MTFRVLPYQGGSPREISEVVNNIMNGKTNNTGTFTMATGGATSTTITDARIGYDSKIILVPSSITASSQEFPYGSFSSTADQTAASTTTAYAMTFNTTAITSGVTIGSPTSRIYVDRPEVYNIQFSAQFINTAGGAHDVWVWLRKNGTNVADSAGAIRIEGNNSAIVVAWNYLLEMNAGDYFELMWEVSDTAVSLHYDAATAVHPAIPSIILTVTDNIVGR